RKRRSRREVSTGRCGSRAYRARGSLMGLVYVEELVRVQQRVAEVDQGGAGDRIGVLRRPGTPWVGQRDLLTLLQAAADERGLLLEELERQLALLRVRAAAEGEAIGALDA